LGLHVHYVFNQKVSNPKALFKALLEAEFKSFDNLVEQIDALVKAKDLTPMNDSGALEKIIDEVIAANPDNVAQFRAGKDKAFNALVGQIMKASKGKANPTQVNELLRAKLAD
jgi:aspartyl-tRNA(Asn)/glutamyl-tRNA(Gln) amidotransferase subunit B